MATATSTRPVTAQNNVPPDWAGWKKDLMARLHAPLTPANDAFLNAWTRREGGGGQNNPFNTTYPLAGSTPLAGNSAGVQNYPLPAEGAAATYFTLLGNPKYRDVLADLRAGRASTTKCYAGLSTWSGGGYCSLTGTATSPPAGSSGTGVIGDVMADRGFGPAYNATPGCHLHTHWEIPTTPFGTSQGVSICWDKTLGVLYVGAGGVLVLAGIAVLLVSGFGETRAGRSAASALTGVGGAVGVGAAAVAAQRPAQRRARATAREQQTAADEARRLAPVRAEDRRQQSFTAAEKRRAAAGRRAARASRLAETRRDQLHASTIATRDARFFRQQRTGAERAAGVRAGRQVPPRRRPADDPAPF